MAGRARFFISYMDECSTDSHTRSKGLRHDIPGGKGGGVVIPSTICSANHVICILSAIPEWSNCFQGQELLRSTPVFLHIDKMVQYISGFGGRGSVYSHDVA